MENDDMSKTIEQIMPWLGGALSGQLATTIHTIISGMLSGNGITSLPHDWSLGLVLLALMMVAHWIRT